MPPQIPQNLGQLLKDTAARKPDKKAILFKINDTWHSLSWLEFSKKVEAVALGLAEKGLKPGDRLAILSENRPEWAITDLATVTLGATSVPIYTSLTSAEIQYILSDSGASVLAVSTRSLLEKIKPIQKSLPALKLILVFDGAASVDAQDFSVPLTALKDFESKGSSNGVLDNCRQSISSDSVASIIYTSGTTGVPKGVMLTHSNFIYNVIYSKDTLRMSESEIHLSFLPLSHVFERMAGHYLMMYLGATIAYAESMDAVPKNLLEVRPTFTLGVPRFYEKIKDRVLETVSRASSVKKGIFSWARAVGAKKRQALQEKKATSLFFNLEYALANILAYKKFKAGLGGRVAFCVSGGAPLNKEIAEFFADLGIMIYEGYGLSETSPVISANRIDRFKFGTVGIPIEGIDVKISEEGEIITRGPCVMKGYFNKPEETKTAIIDGWFHTGDLGFIDKDGFLTITGRKKELIVTSGGKKVAPRAIEELVESDPYIVRCVLFGEGRKFITALVVPDKEKLLAYAKEQKMSFGAYGELLKNPKIYAFFENHIESLSTNLASYEKIKYFALLESDFSQSSGELTPTLKIKRDVVVSRYKDLLLPFYNNVV